MFKLFKKKTDKEKLALQYEKLLKEAHSLSTTNRAASDAKIEQANAILEKIKALV